MTYPGPSLLSANRPRASASGIWLAATITLLLLPGRARAAEPLTRLEYRVVGTELQASPPALTVPKNIAGSVLVKLTGDAPAEPGTVIEATLRGPSFPARKLIGQVNQPLVLPPLNLVGDYQLDQIRLVDGQTGVTKIEANPTSIPVRVFDEVLISRVTSRPLTLQEIQDKGIAIDEQNFRAVEFEVGFVLDGKTIPVRFPVVAPTFKQSAEIIPRAELEKRLAEAAALNEQIASTVELPKELEQSQLNIQVTGINFERAEVGEQDLALRIPAIPALMVIPGNIGFLNQFFSVQIFTENGAPAGSGLSVSNVKAKLVLPAGPDRVPSTDDQNPGDDPLRFARVGAEKVIQPEQSIVRPGADGKTGTSDDIPRLQPGEAGQAEFLVEGLQEGLHVMDLDLSADLEGLSAGVVKVKGKAAGSVLVRNPKFSLAFTHPRTVRTGEPYQASVTVLNSGSTPANLVQVTLNSASLSGGVLESAETVPLGTILPGQSGTATYRVRAQRTGAISFSNLTTSDESTEGRFRLTMGIDERGVALSPDTVLMPDFVSSLPTNLVNAANRVLGQALSIATAGQLPPGVLKVQKSLITTRVLELAEAGQRVKYGDGTHRVLVDLLLDWQGGRVFNNGFDQILRVTDAGREFREALMHELELTTAGNGTTRLIQSLPDIAGRGELWTFATTDSTQLGLALVEGTNSVQLDNSGVQGALAYRGSRGHWLTTISTNLNYEIRWNSTGAVSSGEISVALVGTNGAGRLLRWTISSPATGACFAFSPGDSRLRVDTNCDGSFESFLAATETTVTERPPELVAVLQDPSVHSGRPRIPCSTVPSEPQNYATVFAVLFSKPMSQEAANVPSGYRLENGNEAGSVQMQPGGRVALLNMRQPVGALIPRTMTVTSVQDARGNTVSQSARAVQTTVRAGTSVRGRVVRADGTFAAGVPVTLTYYDLEASGLDCVVYIARPSQIFTDANGAFAFDFVIAGIPYSVSATDTTGLPPEAIRLLLDSATGDSFAKEKLNEALDSQTNRETLLGAFASTTLPEAIARAEGVDRALLRDLILPGSAREGAETVVALRFRGRGSLTGQVLAADGSTPVPDVAVNLFPDPDSRELGRGIFSDANGRFAFYGVPLGVFTVQASAPSGQFRTVAGSLAKVGEQQTISVVLSSASAPPAALRGRVFEPDSITPHGGARVFIGRFNPEGKFVDVVAAVTADAAGFWAATNFPAGTYDVAAISFDGQRKGDRRNIQASLSVDTQVSITLNGRTTVSGRVEFFNGVAAANALVAGGDTIVRTDANGLFTMTGVPTGRRVISAGVERNPAAGLDFPRLGSEGLEVVAGLDNFVVVRLRSAGRITGRVLDALGQPVPNARVSIPQDNGFIWVDADSQGVYLFENLGLDDYTLSAPGPAVAQTDTSGLIDKIRGGNEQEVLAAIGDAFKIFAGLTDPFLTGEPFNPVTWGFTKTRLIFDGQTAVADIRLLRPGTVSGKVLNGQGIPIGAKVRLTGIGPLANGAPSFIIRGDMNSDPALGTFEFKNAILAGAFGLQAASPFFPVVISVSGQTSSTDPNSTNNILQFPPTREINGRLAGTVFTPDGLPAGSNVNVKISFGDDFIIRTRGDGTYDTQIGLPAIGDENRPGVGYNIEVSDPVTGLRGTATAIVFPGVTNIGNVTLLGKGSLRIFAQQANGAPAANAAINVEQGSFPGDKFNGTSDTNGLLNVQNVFSGSYAISASMVSGPVTIFGRAGASVLRGQTSIVNVVLGPTATITGKFVKRDLLTPVGFAQIAIGNIGFATTGPDGTFEVKGIPLGTYQLRSQDPVTGIGATATVTLAGEGEIRDATLIEQARGEIAGYVIDGYGTKFVAGASVRLRSNDGLSSERTVTTGPDGSFSFPGTPAASFTLEAEDPITKFKGSISGALPEGTASLRLDVGLAPLARIPIKLVEADGTTPATNATVRLEGALARASDTDAQGLVTFIDLPLGSYSLRADSRRVGFTRNAVQTNLVLTTAGDASPVTVRLAGVGAVQGTVRLSNGVTPASGAETTLKLLSPLFQGEDETQFTDAQGRFNFANVPIGPYSLSIRAVALGVSASGNIRTNGQTDNLDLVVGNSGSVVGRLIRANGSAAPGVDIVLTFTSQSGLPGIAVARSDASGAFTFDNVPQGSFALEATAPQFAGIARLASSIVSNGQRRDVGDVRLDEDDPRVVSVTPTNSALRVPISTTITLVFSEPLATNSIQTNGIFLRLDTNIIAASLRLSGTNRVVEIVPNRPLASQRDYQVVVIDGERLSAVGNPIASGPTDLVGRPLTVPFVSTFTTSDGDPPVIVSVFPENGQQNVDPRAVMRLSFNEPIQSANIVATLTGPKGPVAGTPSVGVNGLVLTFTPAAALDPNSVYTVSFSGIRDLAGNAATNQPLTSSFSTLDTLGPAIATLSIAEGRNPTAGAIVPIEAVLAIAEPGASVRFVQDFNPVGFATNAPFRASVTLPTTGIATVRAVAIDRFGNEGEFKELRISIVSNTPPVVFLTRANPPSGAVGTGKSFDLFLSATDDAAVTNMTLVVSGPISLTTNFSSGTARAISLSIPSNAVPSGLIQVVAGAVDSGGLRSAETNLTIQVIDRTSPTLSILSPNANGLLNPAQPLSLRVAASDNSAAMRLEVRLNGTLATNLALTVVPNQFATNTLSLPLSLGEGQLSVEVRAIDDQTNIFTATRLFRLPDSTPPKLVSVNPPDSNLPQSLWLPAIAFQFDEPLNPATVNTNTVQFLGPTPNRFTVELSANGQELTIRPEAPLLPGMIYTNLITTDVTDVSGNRAFITNRTTFIRTAAVLNISPTNNTPIVPGQSIQAQLVLESGLGARFFRFQINSNAPVEFSASPTVTNVTQTIPTSPVETTATLRISLSEDSAFTRPLLLPPIRIDVRPSSNDTDGDGLPDTFETANNLDPLRNDAVEDPDNDGLSNLAEFQAGTNPKLADTDGDGLPDKTDPRPLEPNRPPITQLTLVTNVDRSITLTLGGVDPDGDPLTTTITALPAIGRIVVAGSATVITNVPTVVTGAPPRVTYQVVGVGSTNEFRYIVSDLRANSAEAVATFVLPNNAGSDVDGDGILDSYEVANGLDPFTNDASLDLDGDTLTNRQESNLGTAANQRDTDRDGLADNAELAANTNPLNKDTDGDGIFDGFDPAPLSPNGDFDGDGIADVDDPDIDGDGIPNTEEITLNTDARNPDTDGDSWRDGVEVEAGSDPRLASSVPASFFIAQPEVGLILPVLAAIADVTNGVTVAQPEVGLILPRLEASLEFTNGVTTAQPEVGLILPSLLASSEITNGVTVAQPEIGLILPALQDSAEFTSGLTVAQPEIGLILPSANSSSALEPGMVIGEPVVVLRFENVTNGLPSSVANRPLSSQSSTLQFRAIEVLQAADRQSIILEWSGQNDFPVYIEASSDLRTWQPVAVEILPATGRLRRVRCQTPMAEAAFYRIRQLP